MYRCCGCDAPAQQECSEDCAVRVAADDFNTAMQAAGQQNPDPWGWPEQPMKLDIQAGVHVNA